MQQSLPAGSPSARSLEILYASVLDFPEPAHARAQYLRRKVDRGIVLLSRQFATQHLIDGHDLQCSPSLPEGALAPMSCRVSRMTLAWAAMKGGGRALPIIIANEDLLVAFGNL